MNHPPTPEQTSILSAAKDSSTSLMISALAGTGKTTTLVMLAEALPAIPSLALAFNVKIKKELEERFPSHFQVLTLNGLGHRAWTRKVGPVTLDERKLGKILTAVSKEWGTELSQDDWADTLRLTSAAMNAGVIPNFFPLKGFVVDSPAIWASLALDLDVSPELADLSREVLIESIKQGHGTGGKQIISYDDQLYLPTFFGGAFQKYPTVLVDEAQDLSSINIEMIKKSTSGRLIVAGDKHQCHPPGTLIKIGDTCSNKPIEEMKVGDEIVALETANGYFRGATRHRLGAAPNLKVEAINEFDFEGELVKIATKSAAHLCTPNHKCYVRMADNNLYGIYLMEKLGNFRVGIAKLLYHGDGIGPISRAREEDADRMWILTVALNKEQALIEEKLICAKFGFLDIQFSCNGASSIPQHILDSIWNRMPPRKREVISVLQEYGREYALPFWDKTERETLRGKRAFLLHACNLLTAIMEVRVFDGDIRGNIWQVAEISREPYRGKVYGIQVEPEQKGKRLYLANNIVTHNSIYAFRGADSSSMEKLRSLRQDWIDLPLTLTFRCPKAVVARQQEHAPGYTAAESNAEGRVVSLLGREEGWTWADIPPGQTAVLCRNNAPLLSLALKLLARHIGVVMLGRDIGKGLIALSKKILPNPNLRAESCIPLINDWRDREVSLAKANEKQHKISGIEDRVDCLLAVLEHASTAGELQAILKDLFSRERGQVTLASIHRSKGLEWQHVLHLDPFRIPSRYAKKAAALGHTGQLEQEYNLKYVCETRAKETLILANLEDFS